MMLRQVMRHRICLILIALLASLWLLGGCASLCTKRLPLYRDTAEKALPPANMALLITNPNLVQAVMPGSYTGPASGWAEERPSYETDVYLLSVDALDGRVLYQGLCMDVTTTYACEVRPGSRQATIRLDLFGSWGHEKVVETARLNLEPGKCYFLRPDWEELKNHNLLLKVEPLAVPYTTELRSRVVAWERAHEKGRDLAD
ncbi:MAG: hypothetical protein ACYDIC_10540 [Desulfobaccales bacterium]